MDEPTLISASEYARRRKARGLAGGSPAAVSKAIREGRITVAPNGGIDPDLADKQWAENTRIRMDYHSPSAIMESKHGELMPPSEDMPPALTREDPRGSDFWQAATREKRANATLRELEVEREKGSLVDRAGVERAAYTSARTLRDRFILGFFAKYAARLAVINDPWEMEQAGRQFMIDEFTAISRTHIPDMEATVHEAA